MMKYNWFDHSKEAEIDVYLKKYLGVFGKINLFFNISYIIKELVGNANKANLKRVHFIVNNLDIDSKNDYSLGIEKFRTDLDLNFDKYIGLLHEKDFFVEVHFNIQANNFVVTVSNNSPILESEKSRILERIKLSSLSESLDESLLSQQDSTEGAGFGFFIIVLLLKKMGLSSENFRLDTDKDITKSTITIPIDKAELSDTAQVADIISKEIESIPQFPEHILKLQTLLNDKNSDFKDISQLIVRDPALVAEIIKIANSGLYSVSEKVDNIENAIKIVGFAGIQNIVKTNTSLNILMNKYNLNFIKEIMDHSNEVAHYALEITKLYKIKEIVDYIYTAAILHDIGKIIIHSLNPDLIKKIESLCLEKGVSVNLIEDLTGGFNHSLTGFKLAEKWLFPELIRDAIALHHNPWGTNSFNKKIIDTIYIANMFHYYRKKEVKFEQVNDMVLNFFQINTKEDFEALYSKVSINR